MRMLIVPEDVNKHLVGRFVVELNNDQEVKDITRSDNPEFWLEKRIRFVVSRYVAKEDDCYISLTGFYGGIGPEYSISKFVDHFNNPCGDGSRFYRLLTVKELGWLFEFMKKRNY